MLFLLSLAGLGIAVVVFLNMLSASQKGGTSGGKDSSNSSEDPPRVNVKKMLKAAAQDTNFPRPRICPVCGTVLAQHEYLTAALEPEPTGGGKRQAQIYGCRYCYLTEGVNLKSQELSQIEP